MKSINTVHVLNKHSFFMSIINYVRLSIMIVETKCIHSALFDSV